MSKPMNRKVSAALLAFSPQIIIALLLGLGLLPAHWGTEFAIFAISSLIIAGAMLFCPFCLLDLLYPSSSSLKQHRVFILAIVTVLWASCVLGALETGWSVIFFSWFLRQHAVMSATMTAVVFHFSLIASGVMLLCRWRKMASEEIQA